MVKARADLRERKEQPDVVAELERRRDAARADLLAAEARNVEPGGPPVTGSSRDDLVKEVDRLERMTEPTERRAVLERAGLRVALYDRPVTFQGQHYYWRWRWEDN